MSLSSRQFENAIRLAIRRSPLAPSLRRAFRRAPLADAIDLGRRHGWDAAAEMLLAEQWIGLFQQPEIHARLRSSINEDIETELLLTAIRKRLLFSSSVFWDDPIVQRLVATIIQQGINNEHIWYSTDEERALLDRSDRMLRGEHAAPSSMRASEIVLRLAMYRRVDEIGDGVLSHHSRLLDDMPAACKEIMVQHLMDLTEELELRDQIDVFAPISRKQSQAIAALYSRYPYPRWLTWRFPDPGSRIALLRRFFSENELEMCARPFRVLVAGCGTGSKVIDYSIGYGPNAQITAVDLSRASLSYAARMARKHGIEGVRFLQMDLLDLPELDEEFDIVECTGVLHHLQDPVAGGLAILDRVRKGGLVHISLYSETARRGLIRLRRDYELKPNMSDDAVREFRRRLMLEDPDAIDSELGLRWDFFDLSRCRDLLFHPLEHRFTLPAVQNFLAQLDIEFRGLEQPPFIRSQYWTRFPPASHLRDIEAWHRFELSNPDAFASLYEIWARK